MREPTVVSTTYLAQILLNIAAILLTAMAVFSAVELVISASGEGSSVQELIFAIAPAGMALIFFVASFAISNAEEES